MKKFHPTPSIIIGFANQGFNIDTIMEDVIMGEVLGSWEYNGR
jgi:hypothetical protein